MITPWRPRELHLARRRRVGRFGVGGVRKFCHLPAAFGRYFVSNILKAVKEYHLCSTLEIERINQRFTMEFEDRNPFEAGSVAGM